jgi:hypothetical protein
MYFATTDTPTFPDTDLPDAVTINWPGHFEGSADRSGRTYSAGTVSLAINEAKTDWVLSDSATGQSRTVGECLLREAGGLVIDQFKAEYDFNQSGYDDNATLLRVGLCAWSVYYHDYGYREPYTPEREHALAFVELSYIATSIYPDRPAWRVTVARLGIVEEYDEETGETLLFLEIYAEDDAFKDGDQNRPDGTYSYLGVTIS